MARQRVIVRANFVDDGSIMTHMSADSSQMRLLRLTRPKDPPGDEQLKRDFPDDDPEVEVLKRRLHLADIVLGQESKQDSPLPVPVAV